MRVRDFIVDEFRPSSLWLSDNSKKRKILKMNYNIRPVNTKIVHTIFLSSDSDFPKFGQTIVLEPFNNKYKTAINDKLSMTQCAFGMISRSHSTRGKMSFAQKCFFFSNAMVYRCFRFQITQRYCPFDDQIRLAFRPAFS